MSKPICVVDGVGPGNGAALAQRFADGGYAVALLSRKTASRRGNVNTAAFAPAKAAQRSLAESMARSLGPAHIHVSLIIVDGAVLTPILRQRMPDKPDDFFLKPEDIAEAVFQVTQQKPSAWSFELDVRPFGEKW